ncbi:MAG: YqcC family protein [bacterium]
MTAGVDQIKEKIASIEAEMKRIAMWQQGPLEPEKYEFHAAFAMDTMAYSQWLQFVFIPRVHEVLDSYGPVPRQSSVGAQAIREFDGYNEASDLVTLLCEFDGLIES